MKAPHLLIVGCGDIGTRVGLTLADQGWRVTAARRSPENLPPVFHRLRCDYTDSTSLTVLAGSAPDYVLFTPLPADRSAAGYELGYREATASLLTSGLASRLTAGILVSSTRVFAEASGGWVDEQSPLTDSDPAASAISAAEADFLSRCPNPLVLRASGLYGADEGMLTARVARGEASADPARFSNRIHRQDLAALIAFALIEANQRQPITGVMIASDSEPAPIGEVEQWLAARLGVSLSPVGNRTAVQRGNRRCDNRRMLASGFRLQFPSYREGYGAALSGRSSASI